jgi:hypothetical protein
MSRITGVIVALATTAAVLTGSTVAAEPPPPGPTTAEMPQPIPGGVEVVLADGDLLRIWTRRDHRVVLARRHDAATGTWGPRQEVLRRKHLFCGSVDARTAGGAVAVLAECDRYSYSEDQAPTSSVALLSADTVTWASYDLEGEAYEEPGISPDGSRAVWPLHEGYVTAGPEGFTRHRLETRNQEYTATATITDEAQVSYLYGTASGRGSCAIVVLIRTGDAAPVRQEVPLAEGCGDTGFVNVDSDTTLYGDVSDPARRTVVSRADAASPWAVTAIAPASAPGLARTSQRFPAAFFTAPGLPLLALGSADRRTVRAQAYDALTQSWGPPVVAHTASRTCQWGDIGTARPTAVLLADLRCGTRHVVLTTADGRAWQALPSGRHTYGLSPDGAYAAVPGRSRTWVVSAERGVVTLPIGVTGPCDVVVPDGPDAAVLLAARGRDHGWPTTLRHSSTTGWRRLSHTHLPTFGTDCRRVDPQLHDLPYRFWVSGGIHGYGVRVVQRDGEWRALRSRL